MTKSMLCRTLFAIFLTASTAMAGDATKQEIITRCRAMMDQHGAALVKSCVDRDIAAEKALSAYPKKYNSIVSRCMSMMREHGFALVKSCADRDIKAEDELSKY